MEKKNQISHARKARLGGLESIIQRGLDTFVETVTALIVIRDERLFSDDFDSFEAYCADRWGFTRARAYQLIDAGNVLIEVKNAHKSLINNEGAPTIVGAEGGDDLPSNEAQTRELKNAPEGERAEAWQQAQSETGKKQPTAKDIQKVVAKRRSSSPPPDQSAPTPADKDAPPWKEFNDGVDQAIKLIKQASRILYKTLDIDPDGKRPRAKFATGYSFDGSVGAANALARQLERNQPVEAIEKAPGYLLQWQKDARDSMKKAG